MLGLGLNIKTCKKDSLPPAQKFILAAGFTNADLNTAIVDFFGNISHLLSKIVYCYLDVTDLTGGTNAQRLAQMKFNAVNPLDSNAAFRQVYYNNPTANTDGITFNGTTQYLDTNCIPSTCGIISQNKTTLIKSVKSYTTGGIEGCWNGSSHGLYLGPYFSPSYSFAAVNAGGNTNGASSTNCIFTGYRLVAGTQYARLNGTDYAEGRASIGLATNSITRGGFNNLATGLVEYKSNNKQCGEILGAFDNVSDILTVETALNSFNTEVEGAFGLSSGARKNY